jgi:hypothetical protein
MNLQDQFKAVVIKRLSKSELSSHYNQKKQKAKKSYNQHEFYTHSSLVDLWGMDRRVFKHCRLLCIDDDEIITEAVTNLTWYDSRHKDEDRSSEFRLYYTDNEDLTDLFIRCEVGDLMLMLVDKQDKISIVFAQEGSAIESQLLWLLGVTEVNRSRRISLANRNQDLSYGALLILEAVGVEVEFKNQSFLSQLLEKFGTTFPSTKEFSAFTRSLLKDISFVEDPDDAIVKLCEQETVLFKILERYLIEQQLRKGFGSGPSMVNRFIKYSLSIQNRRKSRRGLSFENQLEVILQENNIRFSRGKKIEKNLKPDFVFPTIEHYHSQHYDAKLLTLLSLKTTAKERWKQIKMESSRIKLLHLMTLEPAIPSNQIELMAAESIKLVVPKEIKSSYSNKISSEVLTVKEFIQLVNEKQRHLS